jgi:integrase
LVREPDWTEEENVHKLRLYRAAAFIDSLRPNVLDWHTPHVHHMELVSEFIGVFTRPAISADEQNDLIFDVSRPGVPLETIGRTQRESPLRLSRKDLRYVWETRELPHEERAEAWDNRTPKPFQPLGGSNLEMYRDKKLVQNLSVKPLIEKMCVSGLSPRTVNKYIEYVKQVVESLKAPNGEPVYNRKWNAETMDLPIVEYSEQKRPSLKAKAISEFISDSCGQEQALYVLIAATGMRISETLAVETGHFINGGRTIKVEQQVEKDSPQIVKYLKTAAAKREVDLHPKVAEFLQRYMGGKSGLLFSTAAKTPHMYSNLEDRWLTPRLVKMGLDEKGMGWHSFRRFRKTWLRGQRCLEDINNFWMAHKPQTMSEVYSHLHEELEMRLAEAERVGYGFDLLEKPKVAVVPIVPKKQKDNAEEVAA